MKLLDCTLRDGSYAVDFGFTAADTERVSKRLHDLGVPFIEVGHGVGLGASEKGYGIAAASDLDYMRAACGNWGMFAIPGVASLDDIHMCSEQGAGFVRIGCEAERIKDAEEYILFAKAHGLVVFSNIMKSYASPVGEFVEAAKVCVGSGANCIHIVDSAGSMMPDDVFKYANAIHYMCSENGTSIGFHGHNNLGLANWNATWIVKTFFDANVIIDTTLQGIGRSGGNVATEQFVAIMSLFGIGDYDPIPFMQASEELVRPLMRQRGLSSLDVTAGMAGFHSSYMPRVLAVARRRRVDPRRLLSAVARVDKVNCPIDLVEQCAADLERSGDRFEIDAYHGEEQF
jgi:4-hydroxy-2-oxovalerate aldolase